MGVSLLNAYLLFSLISRFSLHCPRTYTHTHHTSLPHSSHTLLAGPEEINAGLEFTLRNQKRCIFVLTLKVADFDVDISSGYLEAQLKFWLKCVTLKTAALRRDAQARNGLRRHDSNGGAPPRPAAAAAVASVDAAANVVGASSAGGAAAGAAAVGVATGAGVATGTAAAAAPPAASPAAAAAGAAAGTSESESDSGASAAVSTAGDVSGAATIVDDAAAAAENGSDGTSGGVQPNAPAAAAATESPADVAAATTTATTTAAAAAAAAGPSLGIGASVSFGGFTSAPRFATASTLSPNTLPASATATAPNTPLRRTLSMAGLTPSGSSRMRASVSSVNLFGDIGFRAATDQRARHEGSKAVVVLVFTHRDKFHGAEEANVMDYLSQMVNRAYFQFGQDVEFLVDESFDQGRPYFWLSMTGRAAYTQAANFVRHMQAITTLVTRAYQRPLTKDCLRGLAWVKLWRQALSEGEMARVRYKPRSYDELRSFILQRDARELRRGSKVCVCVCV